MGTRISLEILHGSSCVGEDDRERAENAALEVLDNADVDPKVAYAEFQRQWAKFEDYEALTEAFTGLAKLWVDAENAADLALTEGWHNSAGAACSIYC